LNWLVNCFLILLYCLLHVNVWCVENEQSENFLWWRLEDSEQFRILLWGGIHLHLLVSKLLNKIWSTKMLTCLNPLAIHIYSLACVLWYSFLAEYDMCSRLFIYCIYTTRIAAQTWRLLLRTRRACHQSAACGVPCWRSAASCSLWGFVVETLGHVMVLILSFTLWHCIWYSLSHYACVTWSWRTYNLCIRVCLQIRVWHQCYLTFLFFTCKISSVAWIIV
jgi:hypothetical protein